MAILIAKKESACVSHVEGAWNKASRLLLVCSLILPSLFTRTTAAASARGGLTSANNDDDSGPTASSSPASRPPALGADRTDTASRQSRRFNFDRQRSNSGLPSNSLFGSLGSPTREEEGSLFGGPDLPTTSPSGAMVPGSQDFQVRPHPPSSTHA